MPWRNPPRKNGTAERRIVAEARHLGETMTIMVGRMETLVERLHEELENYEQDHSQGGDNDERRI